MDFAPTLVTLYPLTAGRLMISLTLRGFIWIAETAHGPRSIPDLNYCVITSLVPGYVNSFVIGRALDRLALRGVAILVQPQKSVGGHQRLPPAAAYIGHHPLLSHDLSVIRT
jgi:hypothetical protein